MLGSWGAQWSHLFTSKDSVTQNGVKERASLSQLNPTPTFEPGPRKHTRQCNASIDSIGWTVGPRRDGIRLETVPLLGFVHSSCLLCKLQMPVNHMLPACSMF